ncbi:MAG: hypothetical protein ACK413_00490 [Patescibacteria group bacterium]
MLTQRKKKILKKVVEKYIKKARPVSSKTLVKKDFPEFSSATIRNEMLDLTRKGLLLQPHTSAGRIPTLAGFRFFLENFLKEKKLSNFEKDIFLQVKREYGDKRKRIKELAKRLAEISKELVIIAFSKDDFYYTGFSYLFRQPEFKNLSLVENISQIIDHLDETMKNIFDKIKKLEILIGEKNPFGDKCGAILDRIEIDNKKIIVGLLGPLRMDYNKNIGLIRSLKNFLK